MEELEKMKKAYNEFIKKAEELAEKIKEKEVGVWNPEKGEEYYSINGGYIRNFTWNDDDSDETDYEIGNCFKSPEEAEKVKRHLITRAKLQRIADRLNKGQEIDWNDEGENKYYLYYNFKYNTIYEDAVSYNKQQGVIYCLDNNFKDIAIKEIGQEELENYLKGE